MKDSKIIAAAVVAVSSAQAHSSTAHGGTLLRQGKALFAHGNIPEACAASAHAGVVLTWRC